MLGVENGGINYMGGAPGHVFNSGVPSPPLSPPSPRQYSPPLDSETDKCQDHNSVSSSLPNTPSEVPKPSGVPHTQPELKRYRTAFSNEQVEVLEKEFKEMNYLPRPRRKELAQELNLNENTIKVWFQNRRMKEKRQKMPPMWPFADPAITAYLLSIQAASNFQGYNSLMYPPWSRVPSAVGYHDNVTLSQLPMVPQSTVRFTPYPHSLPTYTDTHEQFIYPQDPHSLPHTHPHTHPHIHHPSCPTVISPSEKCLCQNIPRLPLSHPLPLTPTPASPISSCSSSREASPVPSSPSFLPQSFPSSFPSTSKFPSFYPTSSSFSSSSSSSSSSSFSSSSSTSSSSISSPTVSTTSSSTPKLFKPYDS